MKRFFTVIIVLSTLASFGQSVYTSQPNAQVAVDASLGFHNGYNTDIINYGNDIYFKAFCLNDGNGSVNSNRGLILFDYSSIPSNAYVDSAFITLFAVNTSTGLKGHSGNNSAVFESVTSTWNESTVTWANQPPTTNFNFVSLLPSTNSYQDYKINATSLIQYHVNNPTQNFGYKLRLVAEDINNPGILIFYSSDGAPVGKEPMVKVYYHNDDSHYATVNALVENKRHVEIFPNPAQNLVTISTKNYSEPISLKMFDTLNKEVFSTKNTNETQTQINTSNLADGLYFIRLVSDGKSFSEKIIVSH